MPTTLRFPNSVRMPALDLAGVGERMKAFAKKARTNARRVKKEEEEVVKKAKKRANSFSDRTYHVFRKIANSNRSGYVALGDAVKATGKKGEAFLFFIPSLILATPFGGMPGFSLVLGLFCACIAAQLLLEKKQIWIPPFLRNIKLRRKHYRKMVDKVSPAIDGVAKTTERRLEQFATPAFKKIILITFLLLSLIQIPMEVVPFGHYLPAWPMLLMSIGLIAQDGAFVLAGLTGIALIGASVSYAVLQNQFF